MHTAVSRGVFVLVLVLDVLGAAATYGSLLATNDIGLGLVEIINHCFFDSIAEPNRTTAAGIASARTRRCALHGYFREADDQRGNCGATIDPATRYLRCSVDVDGDGDGDSKGR